MEQALNWFDKAAGYGYADVTTAATFETGAVYQGFGRALLDSERPKKLSALELEQYNILLEEQAEPFDEKAIKTYENNLRRISQGVYDQWIAKSAARSEEHTSELQSLMRISYAVFCLKKKTEQRDHNTLTMH